MECLIRNTGVELTGKMREQIVSRVRAGVGLLSCKIRYVIVTLENIGEGDLNVQCRIQLLRDGFDAINTVTTRKSLWAAFDACLKRSQRAYINRIKRAALYKLAQPQPIKAYLDVMYQGQRA